jgi:competence protein ComEC
MSDSAQHASTSRGYAPLVLLLGALVVGIVADRAWPLAIDAWLLGGGAALIAWLVLRILRQDRVASWALLSAILALGGAWHHRHWRLYADDAIGRMVREEVRPICVEAIALTSPRFVPAPRPTPLRTIPVGEQSELVVSLAAVRSGNAWRSASGRAQLEIAGPPPAVRAGDRLRIMALCSRPAAPLNPGEFDFAVYERSRRVGCRLFAESPASIERLAVGGRWLPRRWLADLRAGGVALLGRHIVPERAALAAAVLLGTREQLDAERNQNYLVTGTIHVLSISGLHVGILAAVFFIALRTGLAPPRLTLIATMAITVAYAILTDAQPPVVRAAILVVAACLGLWSGRTAVGFNTLAGAGIFVLALNPSSLFLAGTQLSFLAVATMIAFQPLLAPRPTVDPLDRLIAATRPWPVRAARHVGGFLWRIWLTGALIWLVSTPLGWKQYHLISPVALVLNFLMWLPVSLAMYSGLGTLLLGGTLPLGGRICGVLCDWSLEVLERLIAAGSDWPGNHFWLAAPPGWWIGLLYAVLGMAVAFPALRPGRHWLVALVIMWTAGAALLSDVQLCEQLRAQLSNQARPLTCRFVAVGHGVSVLVELPDGKNLLYDCGRLGSPLSGVRPISSVLWSRGIGHLDSVFVSHADADHFNALPGLLERFSVGTIYVSPVMFETLPPAVRELREAIARADVRMEPIHAGQRLASSPDIELEVLHPPRKGVYGSDNANSIVLRIEHRGRRILLTGDLETPGLDDLLAEEPLDCDAVLAPHHGSPRSNPGGFADWSTPEFVVIGGRLGLADRRAAESVKHSFRLRGAEVYHTAEDGCISVEISSAEIAAHSFRPHVRSTAAGLTSANLLQAE